MIKKFLVNGPQIYFASSKQEIAGESFEIFEMLMPLEVYQEGQKQIERLHFYLTSYEDPVRIRDVFRQIYKLLAPYATSDKDRNALYALANKK